MKATMKDPDLALARRLLTPLPYRKRLVVGRFVPSLGTIRSDVRGLDEMHRHLAPDDRTLPGINLPSLVAWIGDELGDLDLARRVAGVVAEAPSYAAACFCAYEVLGERLAQARRVAGKEDGV